MGNSDYILGFFIHFLFTMTVVKHWNTVQKGGGITISGGVQVQTGQSPEESLFWAHVGLDDLWTFHSAWQGIEQRMKAYEEVRATSFSRSTSITETIWRLAEACGCCSPSKAQPDKTGEGRVTGFAATESFTPARGTCTHLQLFE